MTTGLKMPIKMLTKILKFCVLSVPALFVFLGAKFEDFFYFILAFISIVFWFLILRPGFLSKKTLKLPKMNLPTFNIKVPKIHEPEFIEDVEAKTLGARFSKRIHLPLISIFVVSQFVFLYLAVFKLPDTSEKNILVAYFKAQLNQISSSWLYFFVGILIAVIVLVLYGLKKRQIELTRPRHLLNTGAKSLVVVLFVLALSLGLSFLSLYAVGVAHANSVKSTDITSGEKNVLERLKNMDKAPKIVGVEKGLKRTLIALNFEGNSSLGKFYSQKLIGTFPDKFLLIKVPNSALVMYGNNLLITEMKKSEIELVSPTVTKLLVKQELEPRHIKDEPEVKVLSRQEYLKYRDDQINKQLDKVDEILVEIQRNINIANSNIQIDKNNIAEAQNLIASAQSKKEADYNQCKTAGYYSFYFGTFYRYYTDAQCDARRQEWDNYVAELEASIRQNQANLSYDQSQLALYQDYKQIFENFRPYVEAQKDSAPDELGLFEPERSVKVVLESTSDKAVGDYFATLVHEYLHYTSYVSEERQFTYPFFEEALTEYFSRKIIKDQLGLGTNLGYPVQVKVIDEITKKVSEDKLRDVYFNKDEKMLIALLTEAYGSKFYAESDFHFQALSYLGGKDALKAANNIMFKIGGKELKEEDLYSSFSELR